MYNSFQNQDQSYYDLFNILNTEEVEYIYRGMFNTKITDGILSLAETNLDSKNSLKIRKRVYFILVEGLQNITRHQDKSENDSNFNEGFLVIQKKYHKYLITTGNLITNQAIDGLKDKLEKINQLDAVELKKYYRQILDNETFSQKGGAGLGLIEIARKSGNKLFYDFQKVSEKYSFFYMQTIISLKTDTTIKAKFSLDNMKVIHNFFTQHDIILNVTGIFNNDKLVYILSIIESHIDKQLVLKNKMFSLLIELIQNIVKHAAEVEYKGVKGKHSVLFITNGENGVTISTGNFVENKNIKNLDSYLKSINNMTTKELYKSHFETLVAYKSEKKTGYRLGLLDARIKSGSKIIYKFHKIDNDYSFISFKVNIIRKKKRSRILEINKTQSSPKIILNEKDGVFNFCGNSFPSDPEEFYKPIIEWIREYSHSPRLFSLFKFKFILLSTGSQEQLVKVLKYIEEIAKTKAVAVRWYYQPEDYDAFNFGVEFSKLFNIDFKLLEIVDPNC